MSIISYFTTFNQTKPSESPFNEDEHLIHNSKGLLHIKDLVLEYLCPPKREKPSLEDLYTLMKARQFYRRPLKGTKPDEEQVANRQGLTKEQRDFVVHWCELYRTFNGWETPVNNLADIGAADGDYYYYCLDIHHPIDGFDKLIKKIIQTVNNCLSVGYYSTNWATLIEFLIIDGVDVNQMNWGKTPLHVAVEYYSVPMTKALLASPTIDIAKRNYRKLTPLQYAKRLPEIESHLRLETVNGLKKRKEIIALLEEAEQSKAKEQSSCTIM